MDGMNGISVLKEAIATIPIPAAPPRLSMDGAAVGLGFLDAALRLNHIRRLTERLTIEQHRIARRTTEVDISISMLTDNQRVAARMFQNLVTHSSVGLTPAEDESTIWVPVARLSRTHVGPIEVHDSAGHRVPRLTQYETSRLIASGLYRLLRGILVSDPDALDEEKDLCRLLFRVHEPRWLIQSAILTVLTEGSKPREVVDRRGLDSIIDRAAKDPHRGLALRIFDNHSDLLGNYIQLFDIAVRDYIVVVALNSESDEHLLTYEAPLYLEEPRERLGKIIRLFRASRQGYYVKYRTDIPTTLRSYHLVAESTEGVVVERIFLTTNAHESEVQTLARDLQAVAHELDEQAAAVSGRVSKALDLELQTLLLRLSELLRRCRWEASIAGVPVPEKSVAACSRLVGPDGEHGLGRQHPDGRPERVITSEELRRAAQEIEDYELRYDISVEAQPTSNRAHAYWRGPPLGPVSSGRTHVRSGMLLRNTGESSTRAVTIYALMVATVAYLIACFLARSAWPYQSANAFSQITNPGPVITILLLVPGFWYTRLSLPARYSVAGHLRTFSRLVAYICVSSAVALAIAVGAEAAGWLTRLVFILASAVPLASIFILADLGRKPTPVAQTLARLAAPRWVSCEEAERTRSLIPDAEFRSTRGTS